LQEINAFFAFTWHSSGFSRQFTRKSSEDHFCVGTT
jgi:hypothetical protein